MYNEDSKPVFNNLIVKTDLEDTKKTEGGLVVSSDIKARNAFKKASGTILKLGELCFLDVDDKPKVGDEVFFQEHGGEVVKEDKDNYVIRVIQDVDVYMCNPNKEE